MAASSNQQRRIAAATLLSTLAITAVLVASGGTRLAATALLPLDPSANSPESLSGVQAATLERADAIPILRRNIFDHESGDLSRPPAPPPVDPPPGDEEVVEEELDPNAPPPPCDGSMRLVGAFVRMRSPDDSFAAITNASGESLLYQAGMDIDERQVVSIQHNMVVLRPRDGRLCSLTMFAEAPRVATASSRPATERSTTVTERTPPRAGPTGVAGVEASDLESGISQVNEGEYSIDRSLVDRLLSNQAALMRTARVIPHEENGRVVGVKLYGIRRSSLLGRLGIQNGDMLRTINGYDMTAPDSALEAYARLRSANRITVNLARRGQDQTIDYQIR